LSVSVQPSPPAAVRKRQVRAWGRRLLAEMEREPADGRVAVSAREMRWR